MHTYYTDADRRRIDRVINALHLMKAAYENGVGMKDCLLCKILRQDCDLCPWFLADSSGILPEDGLVCVAVWYEIKGIFGAWMVGITDFRRNPEARTPELLTLRLQLLQKQLLVMNIYKVLASYGGNND